MDLNLVAAFVRVVEAQSFTAAAKALGLPKSSVSRRVTELEKELGVPLLHRTTRKLSLTEAGRAYFEQAGRALTGLEAAAEAAAGMDREPRGIVRLSAPVNVAVMGLAELLEEFARRYPEIHVELAVASRAIDLVADGFDVAVCQATSYDRNLVVRRVGSATLGLFAAASYLERRGRPRTVAELAQHDAVLFRGHGGKAVWRIDGPGGEISTVEVSGHVNADEVLFVRQAVGAGLGVGLLPLMVESACGERRSGELLQRVLPDYSVAGPDLTIVTPSGPKRPKRVTLLRDFLVEQMSSRCSAKSHA